MLQSPSKYIDHDLLSETSYTNLDMIDTCYASINEGNTDSFTVTTALSYTKAIVLEVLDAAKQTLMSLYTAILSQLNNYILNSANLASKYRDLIIARYAKLSSPLVYKTYTYPKLYDKQYPAIIKANDISTEIEAFEDTIIKDQLTPDTVNEEVNKRLVAFSRKTIGSHVEIYDDVKSVVRTEVTREIYGREVVKTLQKSDLSEFIDEIIKYKPTKDSLNQTKASMIAEYDALKTTYMKAMKKKESRSIGVASLKSPEAHDLYQADVDRFAAINVNLTQLFNGYITIYNEAFTTKFNILQEHINANREIITKLLIATGVFASVNAKNPPRNKTSVSYKLNIR